MLKPEPRLLSSPGIIGIYTAGTKILVGILNASCWLVHSAAPSHPMLLTCQILCQILSPNQVTWQGYCFIMPLRGATWKLHESCGAPRHYRTGSPWVWCQADQLHLAHRITEEERRDISASMKQRVTPAVVDPHTKPVF